MLDRGARGHASPIIFFGIVPLVLWMVTQVIPK